MTNDEQRIFVCEWMGWDFDPIEARGWESQISNHCWCKNPDTSKLVIKFGTGFPPLTLDWLHTCEEKLHPNRELSEMYVGRLKDLVYRTKHSGCSIDFALLNATAEQRLAALVETIKHI